MEWGWLLYAILQCGHYIMPYGETSERQSDSKVQTEITPEVGMDDREMTAAVGIGGIDGLHASVESENEVVEVETHAQTVGDGYLAPEGVELELSARLVAVVAQGPYIARVNKERAIELPEDVGTIFGIEVELDVARLVDEVDAPVVATE